MEPVSYTRFVVALVFVLALVGLMTVGLRYLREKRLPLGKNLGRKRRLELLETLILDARHKVVLFRRDGTEHGWLLGPEGAHELGEGTPHDHA